MHHKDLRIDGLGVLYERLHSQCFQLSKARVEKYLCSALFENFLALGSLPSLVEVYRPQFAIHIHTFEIACSHTIGNKALTYNPAEFCRQEQFTLVECLFLNGQTAAPLTNKPLPVNQ